jgi:glycosyltransferase involved in cell wall biosynthesis
MAPNSMQSENMTQLLSLVVPVLNEEESIELFAQRISGVAHELRQLPSPYGPICLEVVFIDDGSTDNTINLILALEGQPFDVRLVKLTRNFGKDAALAAGFCATRGDAVVAMDVDLQDPPELLSQMVEAWTDGAMVVNAKRADRSSDSWFKRHSAEAFYALFDRISNYAIPRNVGDFRLLDRKVVDQLNAIEERIRFNKGIVAWLGYKAVEVTYTRNSREAGSTKWRAWSLWNFALDGITGSSTLPLRIWSYVGGFLAILALCYAVFLVIRTLIFGVDQPGYASLMVVTLILGGANMIAIGILGEYVGRISIEVKRRPLFLVEETYDLPRSNQTDLSSIDV